MDKEKAIFFLNALIGLIESDRVHVSQLEGKTADEVLAMAEVEANKAVDGANKLKTGE